MFGSSNAFTVAFGRKAVVPCCLGMRDGRFRNVGIVVSVHDGWSLVFGECSEVLESEMDLIWMYQINTSLTDQTKVVIQKTLKLLQRNWWYPLLDGTKEEILHS